MKSKVYSDREISVILKKNGFHLVNPKKNIRGDHYKYTNEKGETIVITRNCNPCVFNRLVKTHGLVV